MARQSPAAGSRRCPLPTIWTRVASELAIQQLPAALARRSSRRTTAPARESSGLPRGAVTASRGAPRRSGTGLLRIGLPGRTSTKASSKTAASPRARAPTPAARRWPCRCRPFLQIVDQPRRDQGLAHMQISSAEMAARDRSAMMVRQQIGRDGRDDADAAGAPTSRSCAARARSPSSSTARRISRDPEREISAPNGVRRSLPRAALEQALAPSALLQLA